MVETENEEVFRVQIKVSWLVIRESQEERLNRLVSNLWSVPGVRKTHEIGRGGHRPC